MLTTYQWERKSSIKNRPRRFLGNNNSKYFFPPAEQPLCLHPLVINLGEEAKRYILVQSAYIFMRTIFINETKVINKISSKIINHESSISFPSEIHQQLLTVIIDETYHAYVANDFISQVTLATGIKPIDISQDSSLSNAIRQIGTNISPKYQVIFEIIAACIAENSITKDLISISKDPDVNPLFYELNNDHIIDEGRHCRIFANILTHLWQEISDDAKNTLASILPEFIQKYLSREIIIYNNKKILLDFFEPNQIDKIIYDSYPEYSDIMQENPIVKNITKLLKKSGVKKSNNLQTPNHTVIDLFFQQANVSPDKLAIVDGDCKLTYQELANKVQIVAHNLTKLGLPRQAIIAVIHEPGYEYIILILGIMKAGLVFMPLSHEWPEARLQQVLQKTNPSLIIRDDNKKLFELDLACNNYVRSQAEPDKLAYIIHTSGSSGEPKGVMISHLSLANFALSAAKTFPITKHDRVLQSSPYCFDPSLAEITASLISGATLCVRTKNMFDTGSQFFSQCKHLQITVLNLPTSLWYELILDPNFCLSSVKTIIIGGEAVKNYQLEHWYKHAPAHIKLLNTYGPTETTIAVTACDLGKYPDLRLDNSLIGSAFAQANLLVLDEDKKLLAHGAVGELYVGGPGVGLGYFGRPDLTSENFLQLNNSWFYKTGDLVKWVDDQVLAFIGRKDNQVKIRGFRVELAEVEKIINNYPGVTSSRVIFHDHLVAFITGNICTEKLKLAMQKLVPDHMVPNRFIITNKLPKNTHNKIDNSKLTKLLDPKNESRDDDVVNKLAIIWQSLLSTKNINTDSDFFYLGGHSLIAMRLLAMVNQEFNTSLTLREILLTPRFEAMATLIIQNQAAPLSPTQEAMWIIDQLQQGQSINYNIAFALHFKNNPNLNITMLEKSLNNIINRHMILRSVFINNNNILAQKIVNNNIKLVPELVTLGDFKSISLAEARKAFDLAKDPPLRIRLFQITNNYHILLINHHHIIHDGHSIGLFINELFACYEAYLKDEEPRIFKLKKQYTNYAQQLRDRTESLDYWCNKLHNYTPLQLPWRKPDGRMNPSVGLRHQFSLTPVTTRALRKLCQEEGCTLFVGLLTAIYILLHRESKSYDISIASTMSTREYDDDAYIIGVFINIIILRQNIRKNIDFKLLLQEVKKTILEATANRFLPLEQIIKKIKPTRLPYDYKLFDIMVNFHHREQNFSRSGLVEFIDNKTAKFGLTFEIFDNGEDISIELEYSPDLYEYNNITNMANNYTEIINSIC